MFRRGIGGENLDIMKRDDKRSPQVTGLCLRALAGKRGGGLGSPAYCARFYFGSHVFWSLFGRHPQTKQNFASFRC